VTRKETRRQWHAREPTTGAKVSDLSVTVRNQALNMWSSNKRVEKVSRCALEWIADARKVDCRVPCIQQSQVRSDDCSLGSREFRE
jgi:predicted subunit of tRNA(5-methylaminomethyl-2-thiouridylate) methyltransferase